MRLKIKNGLNNQTDKSLICTFLCLFEKACLILLLFWCFSWLDFLFGFFFIVILIVTYFAIVPISFSDEMADIVLVLIKIKHVSSGKKVDAVKLNMINDLSIFDSTVPQVPKQFRPKLLL
jgi:hypothetical protein